MNSIRTKTTLITVAAIVLAVTVTAVLAINAIIDIGKKSSDQILRLLCETGEKNLDAYFDSVEHAVATVSSYAETDLEETDSLALESHMERLNTFFRKVASQTNGVLTYYYRIDPAFSKESKGFWYVNEEGTGFVEHEVTDITSYDTTDTSALVWFTVPKMTGKSVWLQPYFTENLDVLVLSYNVPIYQFGRFVGVIGIETDYNIISEIVNSIKLYDNGYAFINKDNGDIICHPNIDVETITGPNKLKVPEGLLSSESVITYTFEGVEKQAVWLRLGNGMRLNVTVPVSEINGDWESIVWKIAIVSVVLLIVFILVTTHFSGHITKPLRELTKAAAQVTEGNYDVKLDYHGSDEVGVLSQSFGQLVGNIKTYIGDLNELNDQLKEDNLTLEAATIRDSLTGVRNRFALRRDYNFYGEQHIHLMMLDIDDFKGVNDNFGHSVGDYLLKKTGDALIDIFGSEYSYRYGGDEFMVILPDYAEEDFQSAVEVLKDRLESICLEDKKLPVHFSAGYVYGRTDLGDDLRLMLRQADELLYKCKGSGKSTFKGEPYDREYASGIKKREEEAFRKG